MARQALLARVPIPAEQVHAMYSAGTPAVMASRYEALLQSCFTGPLPRFDLVFLGLGTNGHTASLFPATPVLDETQRWVREVYVAEQDLWRVTLTAPVLNQAETVAFLVAGGDKADVLPQVIQGPADPKRLPAQLIRPSHGELRWLVDRSAARKLVG
jgi:6-phosphogluconolactonase